MPLNEELLEKCAAACYDYDDDKKRNSTRYFAAPETYVALVYPIIRESVLNETISKEYVVKTDLEKRIRAAVIEEVVEYLRTTDQSGYIGPGFKRELAKDIEREFK